MGQKPPFRLILASGSWGRRWLMEQAGYEFEGRRRKAVTKDGQTIDDLLYAIIRQD